MIPYGRQHISDDDVQAVVNVLKSDYLTQGPIVPQFEKSLCDYTNAVYGVAVNSATSGLHLACLALKIGKGDLLWTTPITFVASANCALYCGAKVDFVDIDPLDWNLSVERLKEKLIQAKLVGKLPKVLVIVHFSGLPCDIKEIYELSLLYGFRIIEDAAHAIGGKYFGNPLGNCQYSDITVFSFHPVKTITTGEGGMVMTNDSELAKNMRMLRSHGVTRDPTMMTYESHGGWYYQQIDLGYNYRLTDLQAALGLSQLLRLDEFVDQRHKIADRYDYLLEGLPLQLPMRPPLKYSGLHLYVIRVKCSEIEKSKKEIYDSLRKHGIGVNVHYIPVHTQPYYQHMGFKLGDFPESESYYAEAISLPMFPSITQDEQDEVVRALQKALI